VGVGANRPPVGRRYLGKAVQVDPMKPMLKAPGTKNLKLQCDILLSNFAFKSNLRRYTWVGWATVSGAASGGQLDVLKWAREQGCPWEEGICRDAAKLGHLEMLQWARAHGCPWNDRMMTRYAASRGKLEVLKWLLEQGVPWDPFTCAEAASGGYGPTRARDGYLKVLKWLREHHCPWDKQTVFFCRYQQNTAVGDKARVPPGIIRGMRGGMRRAWNDTA
jgi:hypothetical protein